MDIKIQEKVVEYCEEILYQQLEMDLPVDPELLIGAYLRSVGKKRERIKGIILSREDSENILVSCLNGVSARLISGEQKTDVRLGEIEKMAEEINSPILKGQISFVKKYLRK